MLRQAWSYFTSKSNSLNKSKSQHACSFNQTANTFNVFRRLFLICNRTVKVKNERYDIVSEPAPIKLSEKQIQSQNTDQYVMWNIMRCEGKVQLRRTSDWFCNEYSLNNDGCFELFVVIQSAEMLMLKLNVKVLYTPRKAIKQ